MKIRISQLIFLFLLVSAANAQGQRTFYVSATGNDFNDGLSPANAWKTIEHVNNAGFIPGDHILFRRGDTFRGTLKITASGTETDSIVFGAFGSGENPVISGAQSLTGWQLYKDGIYRVYYPDFEIKNLFVNHQQMTLARYPNNGYLPMETVNGSNGFTCKKLTQGIQYWQGADVIFRTTDWTWEKRTIKSFITGIVVFNSGSDYPCQAGWGFFMNNKLNMLDSVGEWYYDKAEKYIYLKPPGNVNPDQLLVEATVYNVGLDLNGSYISIRDLNIEKQYDSGIRAKSNNTSILDCQVSNTCNYGLQVTALNFSLINSTIRQVNGTGIHIYQCYNARIENCRLSAIGLYPEMLKIGQAQLIGMYFQAAGKSIARRNRIDSVGYSAISIYSDSILIEKNYVSNTMLRLDDGGAIYAYSTAANNGFIRNNIVEDVVGCGWAKPDGKAHILNGIYLDNGVNHMTVEGNTVTRAGGGLLTNAGTHYNSFIRNVSYANQSHQLGLADWMSNDLISDCKINDNILVSTSTDAYTIWSMGNLTKLTASFNHNYYFNPFNNYAPFPGSRNFETWKSQVDTAAHKHFYTQKSGEVPKTELLVNSTDSFKQIKLNGTYVDLENNPVTSVTISPYSSVVVVALQKLPNTGIREIIAGKDQVLAYPNPARRGETIHICTTSGITFAEGTILDMTGRILCNAILDSNSFTMPDVPVPGMYIMQVRSGINKYSFILQVQ